MKQLLLLNSALLAVACGSSNGAGSSTVQGQPPAANVSQSPQQPPYTVPPVNSQQAPLNSQPPPANTQQPPLGSAPQTITCDQIAAAATAARCTVPEARLRDCATGIVAGAPCASQWQSLLACSLKNVTCDGNGELNMDACANELEAIASCDSLATPVCLPPSCENCGDRCVTCQCRSLSSGQDCTNDCPVAN